MAAGDTMQGRRTEFFEGWPQSDLPEGAQPGDYCKVPPGIDPEAPVGCWYAMAPNGDAGALCVHHTIVEHEDGTITASPSIVMAAGWHGFLERGVWREV